MIRANGLPLQIDIALECAARHNADSSTLVRAARDFCGKEPKFAATVALFAVTHLLTGGGYDPPVSDINEAVKHLFAAARQIGAVGWGRPKSWQIGCISMHSRPRDIPANRKGRIVAILGRDGLALAAILTK